MKKKILVEGWRFVPHSYACVNMWQCLELMRRDDVDLCFHDRPYYNPEWTPFYRLFAPEATAALGSMPSFSGGAVPDVLLRIEYPFSFTPGSASRLFVFGTAEHGMVKPTMLTGETPLREALAESEAVVVTPSNWSKAGFLRSGAPAERIVVVPHGVDTDVFLPFPAEERANLRKRLSWQDSFVFLNTGTMIGNKGIRYLLKAFAVLQQRYPHLKLCLKGLDTLYQSQKRLQECTDLLTAEEIALIQPALYYSGETVPFSDMAGLYNACDAYVSPYIAEGFNLPVLEAAACGTPVICTAGGPTDDFVDDSFAKRIESTFMQGEGGIIGLKPNLDHLIALMAEVVEKGKDGRETGAGAAWVAGAFTWRHAVDRLLAAFSAG